ncbi:MAG: hypothetical protein J7L41_01995 [Synergistetes bacterium]|nr:hypothetical protein [Synergistota bacterium]
MSLEDIKAKIIGDAKAEADRILKDAEEQADAILKRANADAQRVVSDAKQKASELEEIEVERRKVVAELEVKKLQLAARRELIEDIFKTTEEALKSLPKDKYLEFFERLFGIAVDSGDEEVVLGEDEQFIDGEFVATLNEKHGWKLKISPERGGFERGVVLRKGFIDINLSIDAILSDIRRNWEEKVREKLFA